jgi:hypothetical protein
MQQLDAAVKTGGRVHSTLLTQEPQMRTLRFGRKLSLPSTIAIKHQVRTLIAQYEVKKAEAEARVEVFHGLPSLAAPSAMPMTEINANSLSSRIRPL